MLLLSLIWLLSSSSDELLSGFNLNSSSKCFLFKVLTNLFVVGWPCDLSRHGHHRHQGCQQKDGCAAECIDPIKTKRNANASEILYLSELMQFWRWFLVKSKQRKVFFMECFLSRRSIVPCCHSMLHGGHNSMFL